MTNEPETNDSEETSPSPLNSADYRERLMRKLNCLIAVLEVATKKVERSLAAEGSDVERLTRIQTNLQETMQVCVRARTALEKRTGLPDELRERLARVANEPDLATRGDLRAKRSPSQLEMHSEESLDRFKGLGAIDPESIQGCDFDELAWRLQN